MDLQKFMEVLQAASWFLVGLAALLHFSTVFISVSRWQLILQHFDIRTLFAPLTRITLIGYFFNLFLPSAIGGDFFRAYYLARQERIRMSTTVTTTIVDRLSGLTALLLIGLIAAAVYPMHIEGYPLLAIFLLLAAAFLAGILVLFHSRMHRLLIRVLESLKLQNVEARAELVYTGLQRLRRSPATLVSVTMLSFGIQFLVVVMMWLAAMAIDIRAPFLVFLVFIPLINLSVAVPITINGVGLREGIYFLLFSQIGVPMESAVTLSLLNLLVVALTALPGGIVYSLYKREEQIHPNLMDEVQLED